MLETVACDLCGSDRAKLIFSRRVFIREGTSDEFTVVRCKGCSLLYVNPRPTLDGIAAFYAPVYYASDIPRQQHSVERFGKTVSRMIKRWIREDYYGYPSVHQDAAWRFVRKLLLYPEWIQRTFRGRRFLPYVGGGRLLDVGCGLGINLKSYQEQGWDVFGIEMNDGAVIQARSRVGNRIYSGSLESAPFQRNSFDVIVFNHSLEHMRSPSDALIRARSFLKSGGMLAVTVPNAGSLESKVFGEHWIQWDLPRHLYHFNPTTLAGLMRKSGFEVIKKRTGVGTAFFMASIEQLWLHQYGSKVSAPQFIKRFIAGPFCLIAGHLGCGTEITMYAVKAKSDL